MKRIRSVASLMLLGAALVLATGCGKSDDNASSDSGSDTLPASLMLAEAPTGVQSIADLKASSKEGDTVVIKAVVGGRKNVFVANRAVMTVIDASVTNPCISEDDHCSTPWDYCCTPPNELLPQLATVQILGDDGRPLAVDLSGMDSFKPLNTLVIQGTVGPRDDAAVLVIQASGVYVDAQQG